MPRNLVQARGHDRNRSLGWFILAWLEFFVVHGPGDVQGDPVHHGDEYSGFIADCYALDENGRRLYDSVFLSRPKGCDKSGLGARLVLVEALAPCRFARWARGGEVYHDPWGLGFEYVFQAGEPIGRPVKVPYVRCMATEEGQTGLVYDSVYFNLTDGLLASVPGVGTGLTRTMLPGGGEITPSTASSSAKDGGKETFVDFDESHLYNTPELRRMYRTVTRNLRKRKRIAEPWALETTTMFAPGEDSIAEETYRLAELIKSGQARRDRLLLDHRWGECEDPSDENELRAAIVDAYGDAMEWQELDSLVDEFFDPRALIIDSRRYFLNAETEMSDSWLAPREWNPRADVTKVVTDGEMIVLGFDGSIRDDSTALVACRVSDGHLWIPETPDGIACWEKPDTRRGAPNDWQVDRTAVDAAVATMFKRYNVIGFYADPAHWVDTLDRWSSEFSTKVRIRASVAKPLEWWTNRPKYMVDALERFHEAVVTRELTHDGGSVLTRHVLNSRRRVGRSGITISKEHPGSSRKIDAAMAAVLAYECRGDAVAKGFARQRRKRQAHGF